MVVCFRWRPCWRSLEFQKLVEEMLTVKRIPRVMTIYQFVLAMVLAIYVGFCRLNHICYVSKDPLMTGVLKVASLPGQSTFWRFLASLHLTVAPQLLQLQRVLRVRVWAAANLQLPAVTVDTDTTVHTLYGNQMGARKSYNPKNKGKKSYQPILTFLAETREYICGELRNGDRPDGKQIARHLADGVRRPARLRSAHLRAGRFRVLLLGGRASLRESETHSSSWWHARPRAWWIQLQAAAWKPSPQTDADEQCEFWYQPEGWGKAYRFIALRYRKHDQKPEERRAISTVRHPAIPLSGVRDQHGRRRSLRWCGSTISGLGRRI